MIVYPYLQSKHKMHDIAIDELERHLAGSASGAFYAHLAKCGECRDQVAEMDSLSAMFRELRADPVAEPAPEPRLGFYTRIEREIVGHQRKEAWGMFAPSLIFFRRTAFASLLLLAGLGSYLIAHETEYADNGGADAAALMAQHDPQVEHADSSDRDRLMVTLATYHE